MGEMVSFLKIRVGLLSLGTVFLMGLSACEKNDGIRTAGGGYLPPAPIGNNPYPSPGTGPISNPFPNNPPGGGFSPPYGGNFGGGGTFQPSFPSGFGTGFYPWMPIYGYYQQNVVLRPVFISLWNGWQSYAVSQQLPVYDFTSFWYNYCPQVMSPQVYQYFSNNFYPWMTPSSVFYTSTNPQLFWQNYIGRPY